MTKTPEKIPNFIDGQFVEPVGGKYLDNIEPATGKSYSQVPDSDARDVDLTLPPRVRPLEDCPGPSAANRWPTLLRIADLSEGTLGNLARPGPMTTAK